MIERYVVYIQLGDQEALYGMDDANKTFFTREQAQDFIDAEGGVAEGAAVRIVAVDIPS